jgi:quinol monooxygenase YgiN
MNNVKMVVVFGFVTALAGCDAVEVVDRQAVLNAPFEGPGWDSKASKPKDETPRRVVVAFTHLMLPNKAKAHQEFWDVMTPIRERLGKQAGLIGYATRVSLDLSEDWTLSVWENEEAMYDYVLGEEHMDAVKRLESYATGGWVSHIETDLNAIPTIEDVPELVRSHGRKAWPHVAEEAR